MRRFWTRIQFSIIATLLLAACARAQSARASTGHERSVHDSTPGAMSDAMAGAVNDAMSGELMAMPHMTLTPHWPARPGDSARADSMLAVLRTALARYRDYHVALAQGFKPFLPNVPQKVYHFASVASAIGAAFDFDPAKPTSLLFRKTASGYELVGAMYTAPRRATLEELNARVPLSVGQWHLHTNLCIPARGESDRWFERRDGTPLFGLQGSIVSEQACRAEHGRFFPVVFGWMLHVNPFETDPAQIWGMHSGGD